MPILSDDTYIQNLVKGAEGAKSPGPGVIRGHGHMYSIKFLVYKNSWNINTV